MQYPDPTRLEGKPFKNQFSLFSFPHVVSSTSVTFRPPSSKSSVKTSASERLKPFVERSTHAKYQSRRFSLAWQYKAQSAIKVSLPEAVLVNQSPRALGCRLTGKAGATDTAIFVVAEDLRVGIHHPFQRQRHSPT